MANLEWQLDTIQDHRGDKPVRAWGQFLIYVEVERPTLTVGCAVPRAVALDSRKRKK